MAWHSDAEDADFLARDLYRWFRGDPFDLQACGTGIPVLFRRWKEGGAAPEPVPLPSGGGIRVLVPLVDENFVISTRWRNFVHRSVGQSVRDAREADAGDASDADARMTIVLPVALHPGAFELAGAVASLNFLRPDPPSVPAIETAEQRRRRRAGVVRHQLTEAIGRLLLARNQGFRVDQFAAPPAPISVFLSHAKADGVEIATDLRQEIRSRGQMQSFHDENDLAFGFEYQRALQRAVREQSAAMVVVLTDRYASRPWCRRELRTMRAVQMLPGADGLERIGKLSPVVVVDALQEQAVEHLPELGPSPVLRWRPEQCGAVIDRVLFQVLQYAHDLQRAARLHAALPKAARASTWVVNAAPDLTVLATISNLARAARCRNPVLLYPDPGVTADTRRAWAEWFPGLKCRSFDEEGTA
ncbi:MAG: toll/interleukin-1 receptor domain-containing protein [Planctomycetes bacterium]|nr:toll/interleukin-1 receptor domain-containing protein [Planctomycetota bacterium]